MATVPSVTTYTPANASATAYGTAVTGASFTLTLPLDGSAPETDDKRIPRT